MEQKWLFLVECSLGLQGGYGGELEYDEGCSVLLGKWVVSQQGAVGSGVVQIGLRADHLLGVGLAVKTDR